MTEKLSRTAASAAVENLGWRYLLGTIVTSVAVKGTAQALQVADAAADACGAAADKHLTTHLRADRVELSLQSVPVDGVTELDVELARRISDAVRGMGLSTGGERTRGTRSVQMLEIAIDALDIPKVLPFWRAVLQYEDEPTYEEAPGALVDPARQGPAFWFQQLDVPRTQRNRIHFDITVPHDEAETRIAAALAAGGTMVSDSRARAFWILADPEGNEICVCTWQDRD
jgi:4a-hydroxytetrahydrobiopterin dehydratase